MKSSRLKKMAEAGDPWAIKTLAKLRAQSAKPKDDALAAATDIRQWTDGPNPAPWRIYRLAEALRGEQ
jgi:hypothetical protein